MPSVKMTQVEKKSLLKNILLEKKVGFEWNLIFLKYIINNLLFINIRKTKISRIVLSPFMR